MTEFRIRLLNSCVLAAGCLALSVATGCETIGQDMRHMARTILPPSPTEAARMMTDQYNPDQRREGTAWIANAPFGGEDVYVGLYRFMVEGEQDPTVLGGAIRALGRHGTPDDALLIAAKLRSTNEYVRWEAAKALQRLHNPAVVPAITEALRREDERSETRAALAIALGQYPQDRAFQALLGALDVRELSVNLAAEQSLSTLTGQSFDMDSIAWNRWYNAQPARERFSGREEYFYPTYSRRPTLFERLAFWSPKTFEQPAPPAGLAPLSRRTTADFAEP